VLPPLYAGWLDELLAAPIPAEIEATCGDCAMRPGAGDRQTDDGYFFHPEIKCCTYVPELPNFLVGRILGDEDAALADGRATVAERLRAGVAVTPRGLDRHPTHTLLYKNSIMAFGRSRTLRCPHYHAGEGGRCAIWRHRGATCATWFCKHVRGAVGRSFWQSLHQLLRAIDGGLARWCLLELGVDAGALRRLFPAGEYPKATGPIAASDIDGVVDAARYQGAWESWAGREREFFAGCARLVAGLSWDDVIAICGPEVRIFAHLTREAYAKLVTIEIPPALRVGAFEIVQMGAKSCRVCSYSSFDPLDLPFALFDALRHFDGRPTDAALRAIAAAEGIELDASLVRKLVDFGILTP